MKKYILFISIAIIGLISTMCFIVSNYSVKIGMTSDQVYNIMNSHADTTITDHETTKLVFFERTSWSSKNSSIPTVISLKNDRVVKIEKQ